MAEGTGEVGVRISFGSFSGIRIDAFASVHPTGVPRILKLSDCVCHVSTLSLYV